MKITPCDILEPGTHVQVDSCRGIVLKCDVERDQMGLPISVHTIKLTERFFNRQQGYRLIEKPITKRVNYAHIETI